MAKSRKLTGSRSELYLGSYGYNGNQGTNGSLELDEDDVWSVNYSNNDYLTNGEWSSRASTERSGGFMSNYASNGIPPCVDENQYRPSGGLSYAGEYSPRGRHVATSAPVSVPDWSKIYLANSVKSSLNDWENDDFSDKESKVIPPHEYLAHEGASNRKTAANSVFEGVGRTLKGRDMSRVRDAVWSQTGFNG